MQAPGVGAGVPGGTVLEESETVPGPPGGKALIRLVQHLESKGLFDTAEQSVDQAVSTGAAAQVMQVAAAEGVAPQRAPKRGKGSRSKAAAADDKAPAEAAIQYMEAAASLGPPTATGPQWRSCGPATVVNGQTYGSTRTNVSGRVSALAADPRNPAHVLAGAAHGGVWESKDRGASWAPRTDYQQTLTVGALAFDPSAPATVYCGTGEGDWWAYLGAGVLRSTDGGTTWTTLCTTPFVGDGFYALTVDPGDSRRLYAGTRGGLWTSTDGGTTWTRRRTVATWTVSSPRGAGEVLAACSDGLFRSADNGATWTAVALPGSPGSFNRLAAAIAPSSTGVAYAFGAGAPFNADGVPTAYLWRRAGGTWTRLGNPPGLSVGQAWYDWYLAVAPDNPGQIYCGAIDIHRGTLAGTTWTWLNLSSKTSGDSIHPDQHSIAFESGNSSMVYAGNDGGVYRSPDRGVTWIHCNNGLQISEFEYIAQNIGSSRWLVGGTQDNGTNRWTGSATWEHVSDADGGDCGVNRVNPQVVFASWQWGTLWRSASGGGINSFANITPARPAGEGAGLFYPPFECSATTGNTIAQGQRALYVSRDLGSTWTRLGYPNGGVASALSVPDADTVVVGLTDGRIFRTRWSGGVWTGLVALTTPRAGGWISDLHANAGAAGRLWATITTLGGGRVFRSDDAGVTWVNCSAGLPSIPMNAVEVDTANSARIWVAADLGVYQSMNAGASWSNFSNALPNAFVGDLVLHPHARVLRAGTRNRGVWEIPVDGWMTQPSCGVQWIGSLAAGETRRWFTYGWPATWHMVWTIMPTSPRPGSPQVGWTVEVERASGEHASYWITVRNLTPAPVTFEGRFAILSRY